MMKATFNVVLYTLCLLLSACSLLSPIDSSAKKSYLLMYPAKGNDSAIKKYPQHKSGTILVATVSSVPWLDTSQMAYQKTNNQMDYFALNQWAAKPSELLQPIVVQALESSRNFKSVVFAPYSGNYDRRLDIKILDFKQDFTQHPSRYVIQLQMQLISRDTQQIIISRNVQIEMPCPSDNPQGGVITANQIISQFIPIWINFANAKKLP